MPLKTFENKKKLHGNPGKRRLKDEIILPYYPPKMPNCLSKNAKKHWKMLSKPLIRLKMLADFHTPIFIQFCEALAALDYLNDCLKDGHGMFVTYQKWDNQKGTEQPALEESDISKARRQYWQVVLKFAQKFKLTTEDMKGCYSFADDKEISLEDELID